MKSYLFGNKAVSHKFCPNCGTPILIDFAGEKSPDHLRGKMAINVGFFSFLWGWQTRGRKRGRGKF
jgi:hypothetical protein